jgi:hypothetical protein
MSLTVSPSTIDGKPGRTTGLEWLGFFGFRRRASACGLGASRQPGHVVHPPFDSPCRPPGPGAVNRGRRPVKAEPRARRRSLLGARPGEGRRPGDSESLPAVQQTGNVKPELDIDLNPGYPSPGGLASGRESIG